MTTPDEQMSPGRAPSSPRAMALDYWRALDAPSHRIARALRCSVAEVETAPVGDALDDIATPRSATPWPQRTATTLIRDALARPADDQLVFVAGEGVLTVGDVRDIVARLCGGLANHGIGSGALVAVDASQRLEPYLVTLAVLLRGATVIRLGDTVGTAALRAMVRTTPALMTFSDRFDVLGETSDTGHRVPTDEFAAFVADCPEPADDPWAGLPAVAPDDAALVGFTSGSTGEPKAMQTSHEAVFRSTEAAQQVFGFDSSDIFCTATDFTALSAFRSLFTLPFVSGGRVVLPDPAARENPLALALLCERYGITRLTAVPGVLRAFAKAGARIGGDTLAEMRTIFSGSGVLDHATAALVRDKFDIPVVDYYSGRELATAAYADPADTDTMSAGGGHLCNCLAIITDDAGQPAVAGQTGEIVVHSDSLTLSDLPSIPTSGDWAGWHFTGDLGRILPSGRLEIVGRKKDIIKAPDGTLVSPAEIEGALNALDWIAEASVFSWSDDEAIERIGAAVIVAGAPEHGGERQAKSAVQATLGDAKTPAHVLVLDDLPRVAQNKPDKPRLRQMLTTHVRATTS